MYKRQDLIFFGGIGTYIRAADESDEAAGDRANDAVRIAAKDLRCKVIGEGANLGMTQCGRIEAAGHGIRHVSYTHLNLVGRLIMADARAMRFETFSYAWDPENPLSGERPTIHDLSVHA